MLKKQKEPLKLTPFNILILVLSVYILMALVVDSFVKLPRETSRVLELLDYGICLFFFIDFLVQFFTARNKWHYMRWGWIDLISSIPLVDAFQAGRLVRIIRILRIVRAFRSLKALLLYIFANRIRGTFTTISVLAVLMIIFSAIAILQVETDPNSNIRTAEDALWWAYVTITTVGYGEKYPVTTLGRLIAASLMTVGVGLFGTFTALVASWFVDEKEDEREERNRGTEEQVNKGIEEQRKVREKEEG
jgi:voltage-gated potassium channel